MSGGGGGTQTSTTQLPDWAQPIAESAVKKAADLEASGQLSHVEALNTEQTDALGRTKELAGRGGVYDSIAQDSYGAGQAYRDAASGEGLFGADAIGQQTTALQDSIGAATKQQLGQLNTGASLGGALGSARNQAATQTALATTAGGLAANELQARRQAALTGAQGTINSGSAVQQQFGHGANQLGQVGSTLQNQGQREGDAAYQGVQRLFGLLGGAGSTTTQSGGGK